MRLTRFYFFGAILGPPFKPDAAVWDRAEPPSASTLRLSSGRHPPALDARRVCGAAGRILTQE